MVTGITTTWGTVLKDSSVREVVNPLSLVSPNQNLTASAPRWGGQPYALTYHFCPGVKIESRTDGGTKKEAGKSDGYSDGQEDGVHQDRERMDAHLILIIL